MKTPLIAAVAVSLAVGALTVAAWVLHRDNVALRHQLASRVQTAERPRPTEVVVKEPADTLVAATPGQISAELLLMRQQLANAEKLALEKREKYLARQLKDAESLATNHDAKKGMVRIENLQNCGQATPSAALQTLLWATFKGDEPAMGTVLTMSDEDQERVSALISQLPAEAQANWTPAKIAALFLTSRVNEMAAVEITEEHSVNAQHSVVTLRLPGNDRQVVMLMELGTSGWQMVLPNVGRVAEMYLHGNG